MDTDRFDMRGKLPVFLILLLTAPASFAAAPIIMVLGDSLSAAYGLDRGEGWVSMLQRRLEDKSYDYRVVNASVSGETTSGALARLERELDLHRPDIVIVELGGNDGLRGLPLSQMQANLERIVEEIQSRGGRVLLAGMQLPPNYGPAYTREFHGVYLRVARTKKISLVPFLLAGIAYDPGYFQADGIHPTAAAQAVILQNVWTQLEPLLRRGGAR
jgi:acyl-CoA thioesterase-1